MDDNYEKKKIHDIYSAFLSEYSQATSGLSDFFDAVVSFVTDVLSKSGKHDGRQNGECLEENIRSIQDICFFMKTFCSEMELHAKLLKSTTKGEPDPDVVVEQLQTIDIEYQPPENPNEIYPFELYPDIFTYQTSDPAEFKVGHEEEFFISFIKDDTNCLFFMMKASCSDIVIERPEFRYDVIPSKGTVFGILLDGQILRAVRENVLQRQPKSFKVLLIDFGEIIEISKNFKMYRLAEEMQQIPGQAIFCKLAVNDDEKFDNESYLQHKLFSKQRTRIDRVYKNMLEVAFLSDRPATSETVRDSNLQNLPHPTTTHSTYNDSLTQEELDELNEEPFTTENALEAVMGYTPQDEKRICKYFDPKTNACFKGSHCKLVHTTILKDGWTKDQQTCKTTIFAQMLAPKVGKKVNLFVQYIVDLDKFYCQLVPKNCKGDDDLPAEHIFQKINVDEVKSKLKKLLRPANEFELVFALYEGNWYRAKIVKKISNIQYRVLYVDYGNCWTVNITELRQWQDEFDCYPFQAIECKLDNVIKMKKVDPVAIAAFEKLVMLKAVTATVTSNAGILLVTLKREGYDVGEQLVALNFAKFKPITRFAEEDATYPG